MGWFDQVKTYVWDDGTTPYFIPAARLSQPQADKELFAYAAFLTLLFSAGTLAALGLAKSQHLPLYYGAALHAVSVVWCAIYLGFTKRPGVAMYLISAPVVALAAFVSGRLNPNLRTVEIALLAAFTLAWLWYSLRVVAIARAYRGLPSEWPPEAPPQAPPAPPSDSPLPPRRDP